MNDTLPDLPALVRGATLDDLPRLLAAFAEAEALALIRLRTCGPQHDAGGVTQAGADGDESLSAAEAGRRLGVSSDYLYKQAKAGRLPFAVRIGRRVVFDARGLDRWRRQRTAKIA
jgi:excisionase family DNA binding protein